MNIETSLCLIFFLWIEEVANLQISVKPPKEEIQEIYIAEKGYSKASRSAQVFANRRGRVISFQIKQRCLFQPLKPPGVPSPLHNRHVGI